MFVDRVDVISAEKFLRFLDKRSTKEEKYVSIPIPYHVWSRFKRSGGTQDTIIEMMINFSDMS